MGHKEVPPPLAPGDFQLDPDKFKTGNMFADGAIKALCEFANTANFDHDNRRDIAEYAPVVIKMATVSKELSGFINVPGIVAWVKSHPEFFQKDKLLQATAAVEKLAEHGAELATITK